MPGLLVSEKDVERGGQYRVVKDEQDQGYKVVDDSGQPTIQVLEITPDVIREERLGIDLYGEGIKQLGSTTPDVVPLEYRIGPGDQLAVTVWDHPELTNPRGSAADSNLQSQLVAADGTMFYPYAGLLKVAGMTAAQVRQAITQGLSPVINKPQVDVKISSYRAKRVQVFGEVNLPGVVTLDDTSKGVIEAISERGGLSVTASRRQIFLLRHGITYPVNFGQILSGRTPAINPILVPGDVIQIPDKSGDQVFVLGEVSKQAPVVIQQDGMTLIEALTAAGGLDKLRSNGSGVLVFRRTSAATQFPKIFRLELSSSTGMLLAGEFDLQPRDVIYVKTTDFAKYNDLVGQLLPTISAIYQLDVLSRYGF